MEKDTLTLRSDPIDDRAPNVVLPADAMVGQTRQLVAEPSGEIVEIQVAPPIPVANLDACRRFL